MADAAPLQERHRDSFHSMVVELNVVSGCAVRMSTGNGGKLWVSDLAE